jgi:hypothetical protein
MRDLPDQALSFAGKRQAEAEAEEFETADSDKASAVA